MFCSVCNAPHPLLSPPVLRLFPILEPPGDVTPRSTSAAWSPLSRGRGGHIQSPRMCLFQKTEPEGAVTSRTGQVQPCCKASSTLSLGASRSGPPDPATCTLEAPGAQGKCQLKNQSRKEMVWEGRKTPTHRGRLPGAALT